MSNESPPPPPIPSPFVTVFTPPPESTINEVADFKTILIRTTPATIVEEKCRDLIKKYTGSNYSPDWSSLYHLYQVIRETRETLLERDLTYIQLYAWYDTYPNWASTALTECVYNYGCWKDIKYFCEYCKKRSTRRDHPFILFSICLLDNRIKQDWAAFNANYLTEISYAAKWTPRENSKYQWIYTMLAAGYFGFLMGAVTLKQKEMALNKSKMMLRKILSTLNRYLDTTEIKQCNNEWHKIIPRNVPTHAAFKYHRAFYRHSVPIHHARENTHNYPYSNVKHLADKVNKDYELDKEAATEDPTPPMSQEYRSNFDTLVATFFGSSKASPQSLSIIDIESLSKNNLDLDSAISCSSIHSNGVMILRQTEKYEFIVFPTESVCDRITLLNKAMAATKRENSAPHTTTDGLRSVSIFMEKCFNEAPMTETDRETIKIRVFSRQPLSILKEIFKNNMFELHWQ